MIVYLLCTITTTKHRERLFPIPGSGAEAGISHTVHHRGAHHHYYFSPLFLEAAHNRKHGLIILYSEYSCLNIDSDRFDLL